jgi:hypothetical protein
MQEMPKPQAIELIAAQAAEAGAGIGIYLVLPHEAPELKAAADKGDPGSVATLQMVTDMVVAITSKATTAEPAKCAGCDEPMLDRDFAVCVVHASVPQPQAVLVFGLCAECTDADDQQERLLRHLRHYWPNLHNHTIH